jgi:transcriptional regulator with XRE-family HTH domain
VSLQRRALTKRGMTLGFRSGAPPRRHYLRGWRLFRGLSQGELAQLVGVSEDEIASYEDHTRVITLKMQGSLMNALGIGPAEFFEEPAAVKRTQP